MYKNTICTEYDCINLDEMIMSAVDGSKIEHDRVILADGRFSVLYNDDNETLNLCIDNVSIVSFVSRFQPATSRNTHNVQFAWVENGLELWVD